MAMLVITRGYISKHLKTRPVRRSWDFLSASTSASVGGDPRNCTWGFLAKPWYQWDRHINGISSGAYNFHDSIVTEKSRTAERMALGPWVPGLGFSRLFNRNRDFLPRNSPWSILKTDPLNSDIPKKQIGRTGNCGNCGNLTRSHVVARGPTRPSHAIPTATGDSRPISVSPVAGVS